MSSFTNVGIWTKEIILHGAAFLKADQAPGLVVIVLLALLVLALVDFHGRVRRNLRALAGLRKQIERRGKDLDLAQNVLEIDQSMSKWRTSGGRAEKLVADAWEEYRETTITPEDGNEPAIRNTIRPGVFFNLEDLGFTPGFYRIVPSLFVSVGLCLTFLGLIAALADMGHSMGASSTSGPATSALTGLLTIASAKFIMSLTGLVCSITFTIVLRRGMGDIDHAIHGLCHALERRLSYVSLEDIALRQLKQTKQQVDEFRKIGTELVADLARPLREELPTKISESIALAIRPIIDEISKNSTSGVADMVGGLSEQLTGSVGKALGQASDQLGAAGAQIRELVDRLNESSGRMGGGMETAIGQMAQAVADLRDQLSTASASATNTMTAGADRLLGVMNETLEGIRANTAAGADSMRDAAREMRGAAESFRDELRSAAAEGADAARGQMTAAANDASGAITGAGQGLLTAFAETSAKVAQLGKDMTGTVGDELLGRMEVLGEQFDEMVGAIADSANGVRTASASLKQSGESISQASLTFGGASRDLVAATEPVRLSHQQITESVRKFADVTANTAETVRTTSERLAHSATATLDTARVAIGTEREGVMASLKAAEAMLSQLRTQGDRLDQLDEKLGKAFETFRLRVEAALDTTVTHVQRVQDILDPGLATLRSVVEQAEAFVPQSRRV